MHDRSSRTGRIPRPSSRGVAAGGRRAPAWSTPSHQWASARGSRRVVPHVDRLLLAPGTRTRSSALRADDCLDRTRAAFVSRRARSPLPPRRTPTAGARVEQRSHQPWNVANLRQTHRHPGGDRHRAGGDLAADPARRRTRRGPVPIHRPVAEHRVPLVHRPGCARRSTRAMITISTRAMFVSGLRGVLTLRGPGSPKPLDSRSCSSPKTRSSGSCGTSTRSGIRPREIKRYQHPEVGILAAQLPSADGSRAVAFALGLHRGAEVARATRSLRLLSVIGAPAAPGNCRGGGVHAAGRKPGRSWLVRPPGRIIDRALVRMGPWRIGRGLQVVVARRRDRRKAEIVRNGHANPHRIRLPGDEPGEMSPNRPTSPRPLSTTTFRPRMPWLPPRWRPWPRKFCSGSGPVEDAIGEAGAREHLAALIDEQIRILTETAPEVAASVLPGRGAGRRSSTSR